MHNIAIYEGGKASRMQGVALITTDDGDGGRITWVPQDDRKTGTLSVSENGTYRAEDEGLHSWSKVTVRLAGAPAGMTIPTLPDPITQIEIPTGEIGEIEPVAPAGLEPLDDIEPISAEEAEAILEELEIDEADPDAIEAIADYLGVDPEDLVIVDPDDASTVKEAEPKVEDKGQKATGIDADTGQPATITPSGKEGVIVPDELRIITEPSRTNYTDGDAIDYTGISCALYKDGNLLRTVNFEDLSFPMGTAEYNGMIPDEYTDGEGVNAVLVSLSGDNYYHYNERTRTYDATTVYVGPFVGVLDGIPVALGGREQGSYYVTKYDNQTFAKGSGSFSLYQYIDMPEEGIIWECGWVVAAGTNYSPIPERYTVAIWNEYLTAIPTSTKDPRLEGSSPMWEVGQRQTVPVQWSGDGTSLSASFEIMVTKSSLDD